MAIVRLKVRADFLRVAEGLRWTAPSVLLQMRPAPEGHAGLAIRVGFTATKKLGNAVQRNRAKRRLRAAVQAVMPVHARAGHDYVLVARDGSLTRTFPDILNDLTLAIGKVHAMRPRKPNP
jgi:ribonuclease P protein component